MNTNEVVRAKKIAKRRKRQRQKQTLFAMLFLLIISFFIAVAYTVQQNFSQIVEMIKNFPRELIISYFFGVIVGVSISNWLHSRRKKSTPDEEKSQDLN